VALSLPSSAPINRYLKDRGIAKEKVLASLPINSYDDFVTGHFARPIPLISDSKKPSVRVNWKKVYALYKIGRAEYLLSSEAFGSTDRDVLLNLVQPIQMWRFDPLNNPNFIFTYDPYAAKTKDPQANRICLYDLSDVFKKFENIIPLLSK
jgi:hypothetical protein